MPDPVMVLDTELRIVSLIRAFYTVFHISPAAARGELLTELAGGGWDNPALLVALEGVLAGRGELRHLLLEQCQLKFNARVFEGAGELLRVEDLTHAPTNSQQTSLEGKAVES